jgi:ectoine hydroxylase-related dioxygenase (phytanoyl-CoA dioxygenase family)
MTWRERLDADGFCILPNVLTLDSVAAALTEWDAITREQENDAILSGESGPAYGARNLLDLWPGVTEFVRAPVLADALTEALGSGAGVVRVLYFDKPPGHSWALPWHKDYSLAVQKHGRAGVFTKPTVKAGVPHVVAPKDVLDRMLTVRVHLDDVTPENGPLRVIPGSHRAYHQADDPMREAEALHCPAGGVLLMRPLVTHASGHSKPGAGHRRIVHLECAADAELPDGYAWKWFVPVRGRTCSVEALS